MLLTVPAPQGQSIVGLFLQNNFKAPRRARTLNEETDMASKSLILLLALSAQSALARMPASAPCGDVLAPQIKVRNRSDREALQQKIRNEFEAILTSILPKLSPTQRDSVVMSIVDRLQRQLVQSHRMGFFKHDHRNISWEADTVEIAAYPDQVSTKGNYANGNFKTLKAAINKIQGDLGQLTRSKFDLAIHVLPFFKSPLADGGYDVADYFSVRKELGGMKAFSEFSKSERDNGRVGKKIVQDLILNHTSDHSPEFQKALEGDLKALNMFVTSFSEPILEKHYTKDGSLYARYLIKHPTGVYLRRDLRVIFPDSKKTHWRHETLPDGRPVWFFHFFLEKQPDWNWENPDVLLKHIDIVNFWINRGVDTFRLDAIPFLDKRSEGHPRTLKIVELLQNYINLVAPHVHLRNEANLPAKKIVDFIGDTIHEVHPITSEYRTRSQRAASSYFFPLIPNAFASYFAQNKKYIEEALHDLAEFPDPASLTYPTRTHDEVTLEMPTEEVRQVVRQHTLIEKARGQRFRGDNDFEALGVSGSTAEFFDFSPQRILSYYAFYLSLPGQPSLQLRDIFAMGNSNELAVKKAAETGSYDSRFINRGNIPFEVAIEGKMNAVQQKVYSGILRLIAARMNAGDVMRRGSLFVVDNPNPQVTTFLRVYNGRRVLVVKNLSENSTSVSLSKGELKITGDSFNDILTQNQVVSSGPALDLKLEPDQTLWLDFSAQ